MTPEYDFDGCVKFINHFLKMSVKVARGEMLSMLDISNPKKLFKEISAVKTFVNSPLFEYYCDLVGASWTSLESIRDYANEKYECWQIGIEVFEKQEMVV